MKSRIISAADKILIYGFGGEEDKFRYIARRAGAELVVVPEGCAGEKVGYLAGLGGYSSCGSELSREGRCVIFCMDGKKLSRAVDDMRENGLGGIPLKAMLTPSNREMTLSALMDELEREHRLLHFREENAQNPSQKL